MRHWLSAALRIRLAWKLVGANLLIALVAIGAVGSADHSTQARLPLIGIVSAAIAVALLVNFALIELALRPLHALEVTVQDVIDGNFNARVPASVVADHEMNRIAATVNLLLDTVSGDRLRMHQFASAVIETSDRQRAAVAHELHDSTAQTLAGLMMQMAAAIRDASNPALAARLTSLQESLSELTEDVRVLAQGIHPRVLEDLGLPAALRQLGRELSVSAHVDIIVDDPGGHAPAIPLPVAAALYHVAEEAVANALSASHPSTVRIGLEVSDTPGDGHVTLRVADDGHAAEGVTPFGVAKSSSTFAMSERLTLVNGRWEMRTVRGEGTCLTARVPLASRVSLAGVVE